MSYLTGLALRKRSVTILLLIVIFIGGFRAFNTMPAALFTGVQTTTISVLTFWPGSNPESMVNDVTDPIEEKILEINSIDFPNGAFDPDVAFRGSSEFPVFQVSVLDGSSLPELQRYDI